MALATLSIDLVAKLGNLEAGLDRAARLSEKNAADIQRAFDTAKFAKGTLIGNLVTDAVQQLGQLPGRFADLVTGAIDAQDHLNDLAKRAQTSVLAIGGIGFAASQAGGNVDDAAASIGKLNLALSSASGGDPKLAAIFKDIGISVKTASGSARDATSVLADLADKFASYAEGPEKAALGNAIFGKSYQGILPLLEDGGDKLRQNIAYFERYSGVTADTAAKADQFNDSLTKLHLLQGAFGNNLAAAVLPLLQTLVDRFTDAKEKGDGFKTAAEGIAEALTGIVGIASFVVESLGAMSVRLDGIIQKAEILAASREDLFAFKDAKPLGDQLAVLKAQFASVDQQVADDLSKIQGRYDAFIAKLHAPRAEDVAFEGNFPAASGTTVKTKAPNNITGAGSKAAVDDIDKMIQRLNEQTAAAIASGDGFKNLEKAEFLLATDPRFINATAAKKQAVLELARGLDLLEDKYDAFANLNKQRLQALQDADAEFERRQQHLNDLINAPPEKAGLQQTRTDLLALESAFNAGTISAEEFSRAAQARLGTLPENFERVTSEIEDLAVDAAKTIQSTLGSAIEDVLSGHFENITKDFAKAMERMAAKALETDLGNLLFGRDFTSGKGGLGGLITTLFPSLAGFGSRATGGGVPANSWGRVAENGPEVLDVQGKTYLLTGAQGGKVSAMSSGGRGGDTIIQIASGVTRNELASLIPTLKSQLKAELVSEMRRPGFSGA